MEVPIPNFFFMGIQFLHLLALSVWVGGIAVFLFQIPDALSYVLPGEEAAVALSRALFQRFSRVTLMCTVVLLLTSLIKFFHWENLTPWNLTRYLSIAVMSFISLYTVFRSGPQMSFFHPQSKRLMGISLGCGLTALLMA